MITGSRVGFENKFMKAAPESPAVPLKSPEEEKADKGREKT